MWTLSLSTLHYTCPVKATTGYVEGGVNCLIKQPRRSRASRKLLPMLLGVKSAVIGSSSTGPFSAVAITVGIQAPSLRQTA
jgi:hypothetical protein